MTLADERASQQGTQTSTYTNAPVLDPTLGEVEAVTPSPLPDPIRAPAGKAEEIAAAFMTLARHQAQALIVTGTGMNNTSRANIVEYAAKHRLPAVYASSFFAEAGGLILFAVDSADIYRRAAAYADKIFKGAKPGDLPIEQPTKFELVINMKTAKALGIKIPNSILLQATKVIE